MNNRQEAEVLSKKLDEITGKLDVEEDLYKNACSMARYLNSEYHAQRLGTHDKFQG